MSEMKKYLLLIEYSDSQGTIEYFSSAGVFCINGEASDPDTDPRVRKLLEFLNLDHYYDPEQGHTLTVLEILDELVDREFVYAPEKLPITLVQGIEGGGYRVMCQGKWYGSIRYVTEWWAFFPASGETFEHERFSNVFAHAAGFVRCNHELL